jgi:hypothetical protein
MPPKTAKGPKRHKKAQGTRRSDLLGADQGEHTTNLLAVYSGRIAIGFLLLRGRDGVEAFDQYEHSLGLFQNQAEAARAIYEVAS